MNLFDDWAWLIAILAGGATVAALGHVLGLSRARTLVYLCIATGGTLVIAGGFLLVSLGECVFANDRPLSWQWSPRREFCSEPGSPAALGGLALFLVPSLLVALGAILRSKLGQAWSVAAFFLIIPSPLLPFLYVKALPFYPIYTTPVLHDPYLRTASAMRPARACYVEGIAFGPHKTVVTDETERICVDLESTAEALALTPEYDEGVTIYALDWLGKTLTENGMEPGAEWEGLVVTRVYSLSGARAREDSSLIRT